MENQNVAFGVVIRKLREKYGISQETLAFEADLTRNYISLLENGKRSPTLNTMLRISKALQVSLVQLVERVEWEMQMLE